MIAVLKGLVGLIGLLLAWLGLRWMFTPSAVASELGIALDGAVALNTARGDVGGMFIAGALLCAFGLARNDGRFLQALALLLACVALGRVVGVLSDGFTAAAALGIAVEVAMLSILLVTARRLPGTTA